MARGGAPPAPATLLQIAAGAGYSGRGRRPAAATPSARLFSEHHLRTHAFYAKKIYSRCQRTRCFTTFIMTLSKKTISTRSYKFQGHLKATSRIRGGISI